MSVLAARILGGESFGKYAIVQNTLLTVAGVVQLGITYSATKHIAEFRTVDPAKAGRIVAVCTIMVPSLGLLGALLTACAAPLIASRALGSPVLAWPIAIGSAYVLFNASNSYQVGAFIGLERYKSMVMPGVLSAVAGIAAIALGCRLGGLYGAVGALSLSAAVRWLVHRRALAKALLSLGIIVRFERLFEEARVLADFAIPAAISGYILMPSTWLAYSFLVRQHDGYLEMAVFSVAQTVRTMVMVAPLLMNSVGLSILNNVLRGSVSTAYGSVRKMNFLVITTVATIAAIIVAICGRFILHCFGKGYDDRAYVVLSIMLLSAVVESAFLALYQHLQANCRMWTALFTVAVPWQFAFLVSAYSLIPHLGAAGLAWSYLIGVATALVCTIIVLSATPNTLTNRHKYQLRQFMC